MTAVDYHAISAAGAVLYTTPHRDLALRWARKHRLQNPGLRIEAVEVIEIRRRIWTDRASLKAVQSEPSEKAA